MPRVVDDGSTVELDLHGARLHEAERLLDSLLSEAARRGRTQVRLIHGSSTYGTGSGTIKGLIYEALDQGRWPMITSVARFEGHTILSLPRSTTRRNRNPISMLDIF